MEGKIYQLLEENDKLTAAIQEKLIENESYKSRYSELERENETLKASYKYKFEEAEEWKKKHYEQEVIRYQELEDLKQQFETYKKSNIVIEDKLYFSNLLDAFRTQEISNSNSTLREQHMKLRSFNSTKKSKTMKNK